MATRIIPTYCFVKKASTPVTTILGSISSWRAKKARPRAINATPIWNPTPVFMTCTRAWSLWETRRCSQLRSKPDARNLSYGDERLIGAFLTGTISAATFDAVTTWPAPARGWTLLRGTCGDSAATTLSFDTPNDYDTFSGIYGSTKDLVPRQEPRFILARNVAHNSPNLKPARPFRCLRRAIPTPRNSRQIHPRQTRWL